jgi:hypothetical protein
MKYQSLTPQFVEFIPEKLDGGILYISQKYRTATHLCCCGCGEEVVTPLNQTDWSLRIANGSVTLYPSIGNWSFRCRSHYWIRVGRVIEAGHMTQARIDAGRSRDQRRRDAYFEGVNQEKDRTTQAQPATPQLDWIDRAWLALRRWLRGP